MFSTVFDTRINLHIIICNDVVKKPRYMLCFGPTPICLEHATSVSSISHPYLDWNSRLSYIGTCRTIVSMTQLRPQVSHLGLLVKFTHDCTTIKSEFYWIELVPGSLDFLWVIPVHLAYWIILLLTLFLICDYLRSRYASSLWVCGNKAGGWRVFTIVLGFTSFVKL